MAIGSVGGEYNVPAWQSGKSGKTVKDDSSTAAAKPTDTDTAEISPVALDMAEGSELGKIKSSRNAEMDKLGSMPARDNEQARLEKALADFRQKYGDQEGMSQFNRFMKEQGFELYADVTDAARPGLGAVHGVGTFDRSYGGLGSGVHRLGRHLSLAEVGISGGNGSFTGAYTMTGDRSSSSFTIQSAIRGTMAESSSQYTSGTWAVFDAGHSLTESAEFGAWKNDNIADLSQKAGFDVSPYQEEPIGGMAFKVEAVNTDLAHALQSILNKNGIQLGVRDTITFKLSYPDENGNQGIYIHTNFADEETETKIQNALNRDDAFRDGMLAFDKNIPKVDVGTMDYSNGIQSRTFSSDRSYHYTGQNPTALVMGSTLDSKQNGYVYIKKLSDSVDIRADVISITSGTRNPENMVEQAARTNQLHEEIKAVFYS